MNMKWLVDVMAQWVEFEAVQLEMLFIFLTGALGTSPFILYQDRVSNAQTPVLH